MKKLISLALTLAILASLAISVSADFIVGDRTGAGKYNDGKVDLSELNPSSSIIDIKVATGNVQSRYAVDIVYESMNLSITGTTLEWDVNGMYYVPVEKEDEDPMGNVSRTITVTNYSDQPIEVGATVSRVINSVDYSGDGIDINTGITDNNKIVAKAQPGTYDPQNPTPGEKSEKTYTVAITAPNGWASVANYYAPKLTPGTALTIATITLTISEPRV